MSKKVYTKTGDKGFTSLIGGTRVKKSDLRIEAYGTLDELNSYLGLLRNSIENSEIHEKIRQIQCYLFELGAFLATDSSKITPILSIRALQKHIVGIEQEIDVMEHKLPILNEFVIPGDSFSESISHVSRTVCRRLERRLCVVLGDSDIEKMVLIYFNRLSDFLFVLGRFLVFMNNNK